MSAVAAMACAGVLLEFDLSADQDRHRLDPADHLHFGALADSGRLPLCDPARPRAAAADRCEVMEAVCTAAVDQRDDAVPADHLGAALRSGVEHRRAGIDDPDLRVLQNRHLFHLCPSETEGFGHHLVEGMSCGAITLATDAAPMNEMITHERGVLVPYARTGKQQLATTYFVDVDALEAGVERMLALTESDRHARSEAARAWWDDNDRGFRERLASAIETVAAS